MPLGFTEYTSPVSWWAENINTSRKPFGILWADCSFLTYVLRWTQIYRDKRPVIQIQGSWPLSHNAF